MFGGKKANRRGGGNDEYTQGPVKAWCRYCGRSFTARPGRFGVSDVCGRPRCHRGYVATEQ